MISASSFPQVRSCSLPFALGAEGDAKQERIMRDSTRIFLE